MFCIGVSYEFDTLEKNFPYLDHITGFHCQNSITAFFKVLDMWS